MDDMSKPDDCCPLRVGGEEFLACLDGALVWPRQSMLLVADLHLEKGSSFAARGQFLPPYDTRKTLAMLEQAIDRWQPNHLVCLGDSFHDGAGPDRLDDICRDQLERLIARQRWSWITGNHDLDAPIHLGGYEAEDMRIETVGLCHEPGQICPLEVGGTPRMDGVTLEVAGHLHPVATVRARGRQMRRRAFVINPDRIILPAFGAYTGGLNVGQQAFAPMVSNKTRLAVIGREAVRLMPYHAPSMQGAR